MNKTFNNSTVLALVVALGLIGYVGYDRGWFSKTSVVEVDDIAQTEVVNIFRDDTSSSTASTSTLVVMDAPQVLSTSTSSSTLENSMTQVSAGSVTERKPMSPVIVEREDVGGEVEDTGENEATQEEAEDNTVEIEVEDTGANVTNQFGLLESFPNSTGMTLGDYEASLRGSTNVAQISRTSFKGMDAVRFVVPGSVRARVAVVYSDKIEVWSSR